MRNLKKVLALVIAFSMMLSVVAFAGYNDVDADADYAGAVELLSALDIIKGDDQGNFNPDNTITRAEMAAIICRAKGLEDAATGAMGPTAFTDVAADHWAAGYVNLASQNGIINGYGDGKFGPEDTVTYEQAIKMIVCALGFEPMAAAKGGWPTGYLVVANSYKVTAGASVNATRANIAIIVANAMNTPMMDQTSFGSDAKFEVLDDEDNYTTLLTNMDIYVATGVVGEKTGDEVAFEIKEASDDFKFKPEKKKEYSFKIGDTKIAEYKLQTVAAYVLETGKNKFEVVAVVPAAASETLVILSDDIVKDSYVADAKKVDGKTISTINYYVDGNKKDKKIEFDLDDVEYNKAESTIDKILALGEDVKLTFINNDDDSEFDALVAVKYESITIDSVDVANNRLVHNNRNINLKLDDEDVITILRDVDGNELTINDFAEDDVVAIYSNGTNIYLSYTYMEIIKLSDSTITGAVEYEWDDDKKHYVSIDGKEYRDLTKVGTIDATSEGTFYISMTGKIFKFEGTKDASNYGYILEAAQTTEFSKVKWQVKMLTAKDGVVIFDVDTDAEAKLKEVLGGLTSNKTLDKESNLIGVTYGEGKDVDKRLVKYELDNKGNIDKIDDDVNIDSLKADAEYKANTQKVGGKTLADNVVVMYLEKDKAEDVYATDINFLVDESKYEGYVVNERENGNVVLLITATDSPFKAENGFAIVTRQSYSKDADGKRVVKIDYVQGEVEGTVTFNDDISKPRGYDSDYNTLKTGSLFLFNADGDGVVTDYAVIGWYTADGFVLAKKDGDDGYDVAADYEGGKYGEDYKIGTGFLYHNVDNVYYIAKDKTINEITDKNTVEDEIYNGEDGLTLGSAFKYTYDNSVSGKTKIQIGDYLATENTVFWYGAREESPAAATPVVFVEIDGEIVDIYTANDKVTEISFRNIKEITGDEDPKKA